MNTEPNTVALVLPVGTVTLLLTDIEGSSKAWERDPAMMRVAIAQHDRIVMAALLSFHRTCFGDDVSQHFSYG